jgi:hypothetical protein
LPDISKINALAIGSVSKVDGLAKASILDIDGVAVPAGVAPPLDTYTGASAGYSVRLLRTAYTGAAMRVRRDTAGGTGDDDEADIAFDSGVISLDSAISNASAGVTATTLGEFINVGTVGGTTYTNPDSLSGTASCFVDEWKDQSGNANHASQATFGSQPQIHSGTVNTDLITENGKPVLSFLASGKMETNLTINSNPISAFVTAYDGGAAGNRRYTFVGIGSKSIDDSYRNYSLESWYNTSHKLLAGNGSSFDVNEITYTGLMQPTVLTGIYNSSGNNLFANGVASGSNPVSTYTTGGSGFLLLSYRNLTSNTKMSEVVIYASDQSSNRTGIETNLNDYFQIF